MADARENKQRPPVPLETLGDVQRALSRLYQRIDRRKMNLDKARELRATLQALAALMQDRRDTRIEKQVRELWADREKRDGAHAEH